jgi:hypothetical protein
MTKDFKSLLKQELPEKISQVFEDYRLLQADIGTDVKSFGAYHSACKNALAHICMMMKILSLVETTDEENTIPNWLAQARTALQNEEDADDITD